MTRTASLVTFNAINFLNRPPRSKTSGSRQAFRINAICGVLRALGVCMKRCWCILLVEDDPVLGPIMFDALKHLGHDSVLATTARSAYHCLARRHTFEIVLLDLQLGGDRSEPVIQKLREGGYDVPTIVILSAQTEAELRTSARAVQARAIVQKPATLREIETVLDRLAA
jgi:CheY-like chemotaxis protein